MRIIVDKMPEQHKDCLFILWNCEYGWRCMLTKDSCNLSKNLKCPYLKQEEEDE